MNDAETLRVYATKAQDYAERISNRAGHDPQLAEFMNALPAGADVLDLGCGPGAAAQVMAEAGLRVTATDAVPEMVAMATTHTGVTARLATFDEIDGTDLYDGIWANFSLLHAPRADMPRHLAALRQALRAGGVFHIALKTGTGEKRDTLGRLYTYYTDAELTALLTAAGFIVTHRVTGCGKGLDDTPADWVALRANG
ncbi:Methyltransferase domain-containing protein [Sulfitobacter brevis]|uniref:Methyltransferase domain-containing protein n=1 Tax=Sulfitobacter brevis TaxID=74348 RepID=A0A1I2DHZ9_9RHOB|nr:class I SAM-dependent methyltransferase [Sulfitobacter brevis]SFE79981.1 Methyltransferase domain-containing protein [Sulfitobacter brevis]